MIKVPNIDTLHGLAGQKLGPSPWVRMDQERVNTFAATTFDEQWIHVDVPQATRSRGGTVVHGYLTLALGPHLLRQILDLQGVREGLNYGADRVRFPAPFMVGDRVRLCATIKDLTQSGSEVRVKMLYEFETENATKPACVAEVISLMQFYGG